tara:strand:+ start:411 stop:674 length:264 start_codon:yes stop_codon:yes gene_type:complete
MFNIYIKNKNYYYIYKIYKTHTQYIYIVVKKKIVMNFDIQYYYENPKDESKKRLVNKKKSWVSLIRGIVGQLKKKSLKLFLLFPLLF